MSVQGSPAPTRNMGTLGTLFLVGRKTQLDVQSFPIDAERVTIGRDYDCDIRLYFSDVSKLHCEIVFDLETGKASITVHGGNGIQYTPNGGETTQYKPPSVIDLEHGDMFMLRKKLFRFEYGPEETNDTDSVAGTPSKAPGSPAKPIRRRASHRMSLVPSNSDFVPHSPAKGRRQSLASHGPSKLSQAHKMEDTPEEAEEELVDVVHGEEGDRVFVELKDESHPSQQVQHHVFNNGFSTPQQASKTGSTTPQQGPTVSTPSRVNASVALTTPRGSNSLRKSLLLQSARKTWKETQSPGVDGAIENGNIQTRRKSLSPRVNNNKLKSPPPPDPDNSDEDMEGEQKELKWIEEDPAQQATAADSESDANDSLEADVSLDIPGQSVLDLSPLKIQDKDDKMDVEQHEHEEEEEEVEEVEEIEDHEDELQEGEYEDEESFVDVNHPALPGTPAAARQLQKFYTPQPRRSAGQPRRSIASIGGPAVRFKPAAPLPNFASTPIRFHARTHTPIGKPSRIGAPLTPAGKEVPASTTPAGEEVERKPSLRTPAKEAMRAEAKRRRETLATPRALPVPPASGFKSMAREAPHLKFGTPSHPALAPDSPDTEEAQAETQAAVPATPLNDIKRRLGDLRRQSIVASAKRTASGFAQPSTPASRPPTMGSYSVAASAKRRFELSIPQTPPGEESESMDEDPAESSPLPHPETPVASLPATAAQNDKAGLAPKTPSFAGLRQMLAPRPPPQTPNFSGLRNLFPAAQPAPTPSFAGVKQMLAEPAVPPTPNFTGVREMYQVEEEPPTPELDGVADMYEAFEGEDHEHEEEVGQRSRPSRRAAAQANTNIKLQSVLVKEELEKLKVPGKRSRTVKAQAAQEDEADPAPSKSTRTRRAATVESSVEPESRPSTSRSRRTPTVEPEVPSKPTRRTRKAEATPEVEEKPSKSTRSRSTRAAPNEDVLGELAEQSEEEEIEEIEAPAKPGRKKATSKSDDTSAPSKRGRKIASTKGGKENEPEEDEEPSKSSAPKKTTRKTAAKKAAPAEEPLSASTRTTRSRK